MAHELILVADVATDTDGRERSIERAARRLPGYIGLSVDSALHATVGVVERRPTGGTAAHLGRPVGDASSVIAGVVCSQAATAADLVAAFPGRAAGGESAGVVVRLLTGEAEVVNDGVGLLPSYYSVQQGRLCLSTSIPALLALGVPLAWDLASVVEYLTMLHPLADRTLVRGISLLPAGSTLRWRDGDVSLRSESLLTPAIGPRRSDSQMVGEFREVWSSTVSDLAERAPGRLGVGLSGGLDSRSIASGLAMSSRIVGYTFGTPRQDEVRVAAAVSIALGLPHHVLPVHDHIQLADARTTLEQLDGAHSYAEMFDTWFSEELPQICDVLVSGLVGDCLWGSDRAFGPVSRSAVASSITARYEPYLRSALPFLHRDLAGSAHDLVARGIAESVDVIEPTAGRRDLSTYWNLQNRQRRWGYMLGSAIRRRGLAFEAPFLDRRVLEFARLMSDDQRYRGRLHALIQREVFARTAQIPRGNDGNSPSDLPFLYVSDDDGLVRQTLSLARVSPMSAARRVVKYTQVRSAREVSRRLHWQGPQERVAARRNVFQPTLWIRSSGTYRRRTLELLEEALGDVPDFLDRSAIQGCLDACRASSEVDPHMTARAVSLCLWAGYWKRMAGGAR